jgi:Domain of unknown function DUF11/Bacterial Ig domain
MRLVFCLLLCVVSIAAQNRDQKPADGPISVNLGDVYKKGNIKIEDADLTGLPSLPRGYSAIPKLAYRITTDEEAVGEYTVVFAVPSVTDEQTFNSLRVFHAEPDEFDPDSWVWVDRTASGPDAPAPDFSRKTITAFSKELETGVYVIGKLTEKITPSTAVADLEVVEQSEPAAVQMPANITLSMVVRNNGPQAATDVGLRQVLHRGVVVSVKASQGTCKPKPFTVFCKLGQLPVGSSATVTAVIDPGPDFAGGYDTEVEVAAKETDSNQANNQGMALAHALADPNLRPEVTLAGPIEGQVVEPGAKLVFTATASDPDGSITKVEFLDYDKNLGIGSTTDAKHFSLSSNQLANGFHFIYALATDNGGRQASSNVQHIFVNGPIKVRILEPKPEALIEPGSDLTITAEAIHPSGSIKTLEFFAVGISLGQAVPGPDNRFTIVVPKVPTVRWYIEAVATSDSGSVSKSAPHEVKISKRPNVRIVTPAEGTTLTGPVGIQLAIQRSDTYDPMERVELYANDKRIEEGPVMLVGKYIFTWEDVKPGTYTLKAIVINGIGVRGESPPVKITIKPDR